MKTRHVLAIALLGACTDPAADTGPGGGDGKSDGITAFTDLVTKWDYRVGSGGDAVVNDVTLAPGGKLYVTSSFPKWLRKLTADGMADTTWGTQSSGWQQSRHGFIDVSAYEVYQTANGSVVPGGDGALFYLYGYLANGDANPAFGSNGRVDLPYNTAKPLRTKYDEAGGQIVVAVARAWEIGGSFNKGPSKIEMLAYDEDTGAETSLGIHDLPSWDNTGTNPARIHEIVLQPDGSHVLVASETVHTTDPARGSVGTQWSMIRLEAGQAPVVTHLAVTSYSAHMPGFIDLGGGHFDLYLSATVDGVSTMYNEEKLVRISVDDMGMSTLDVLADGPDFTKGCPHGVATPTHLVIGQSIDRSQPIQFTAYPKSGGAPITFKSDKPQRCLTGLSVAPNGHIYAGTWDTSQVAWIANVTSFEPVAP
jgi:hypothetical protein